MLPNLLVTKLFIPPTRHDLVPRPRLTQTLQEAWQQGKKLTLVSAPAGYGKTSLVTGWLAAPALAQAVRVAWLSLDPADNDPTRFLSYLLATLQQVSEQAGEETRRMLQTAQPMPAELLLTPLINDLAAIATPFMLVLDDYHAIQALPVHQQLGFLVEHQPPQMHLVITTREDPPLPLARLRARGQMLEIRQDDLRFTPAECADFLQRAAGLQLTDENIIALERRTEGWIAGLQLAALALQSRSARQNSADLAEFIEAFIGSSHYVLDYLMEEVFERQSVEEQDFLLKTSLLERLSGALCDAVTGQTGGASLLRRLEHANLFISALDEARTWYRYHHLFADLLRQRLQTRPDLSESELHHRAARWLASAGLFSEAIQHALAAADWNQAAEWICNLSVPMFRRGELITFLGWLKAMPEAVIRAHPQLCRDFGWALILTGQLAAAGPYLDCAERALQDEAPLLGQVLVGQAYLARVRADYAQAIDLAKRAMGLIEPSDILHHSLGAFTLGSAYFTTGKLAEAEAALQETCQYARLSGNEYVRLTALGMLGAIHSLQGRLHRAAEYHRQAVQEAQGAPTAAQAQLYLAAILYEWNDLDGAAAALEQGLKSSNDMGNPMISIEGYRTLLRLKLLKGDYVAASDLLREVDQAGQASHSPAYQAIVAGFHFEVALAQGDLTTASYWAELPAGGAQSATSGAQNVLRQARLRLAQGQVEAAAEILADLYDQVAQAGLRSLMLETRAWQALAANTPGEALRFLTEALQIAQPEGYLRAFIDKGQPMKVLLERLQPQGGALKQYIHTLLEAFREPGKVIQPQPLVEPLSGRELEVLRLLAQGLSNGEIARRLFLTVGTVKTHVHNLISKLGVTNRSQVVARARELALL